MMPRLAIYDDVRTAVDVRARAFAVFERRRAAYMKLAAAPPAEPVPRAEARGPLPFAPTWKAICNEIARQVGLPSQALLKGHGRGMPTIALRQLAAALTRRLTGLSFPTIARHLGLRDHTTALYAVSRMQPLMAALEPELGEEDTVQRWVECALPLLFLHIAEIRAKNRAHGVAMHGPSGKFARQDWTTTSPPEP
jgi:hypothetical protein